MTLQSAKKWVSKNRWWVALIVVVAFGYAVGKDRALNDNAIAAQEGDVR
ncbi:MAG: hypothetical protein ABJ242_12225 [Marinomonas sp.]